MILVTGGTGFIGRTVIQMLSEMGHEIRVLLRPSLHSPQLPLGVSMEVVVCSLEDERGLRAALRGVNMVVHLASAEYNAPQSGDIQQVDIRGSQHLAQAAKAMGVERMFFLSHIGADRASAYPVLKAKGIAEQFMAQEGPPLSVLRSAVAYGPGDHFVQAIIRQAQLLPGFFLLPGDGQTHIQPIRVDDVAAVFTLLADGQNQFEGILGIGGPESLTYEAVVRMVLKSAGIRKRLMRVSPAYLRILTVMFEKTWGRTTLSIPWLDYLSADRVCELDVLPRQFGLFPERLSRSLGYLSQML